MTTRDEVVAETIRALAAKGIDATAEEVVQFFGMCELRERFGLCARCEGKPCACETKQKANKNKKNTQRKCGSASCGILTAPDTREAVVTVSFQSPWTGSDEIVRHVIIPPQPQYESNTTDE